MLDPQTATQAATLVTNPDLLTQITQLNHVMGQISSFVSHVSLGGVTAHGIQWAKKQPVIRTWWNNWGNTRRTLASAFVAACTSLGITAVFTQGAHPGDWVISLSGLTFAAVGAHVWSFAQSYVFQTAWYKSVIKSTEASLTVAQAFATAPSATPVAPAPAVPAAPGA